MTSFINASTSSGVVTTADTSGSLALQTASTTALTLDTSQNATFAGSVKTNTLTSASATALTLQSAGTTAITIDTSQNVGIGATTINNVVTTYRGAGVNNYIQFTNSTTGTASTDGCLIGVSADDTALRLRVLEAAPMIFTTSDTERMRIYSNGLVKVVTTGTTAPTYSFTNYGEGLMFSNGDNSGSRYSDIVSLANTPAGATSNMRFWTNEGGGAGTATEKMRIDTSGNLLVGTTSTIGGATGILQVKGVASQNAMQVQIGTNGNNGILWYNASASAVGSIVVNSGTVAYNTSSDYRMKENIAPMTGALTAVLQLKPCTYTWKEDGKAGQGFIAHELQTVVPDCVTGEKDAVDAEGKPVYQGIDTSFLVATLTAAIQELKAINDTQAETINALTARIVALEK